MTAGVRLGTPAGTTRGFGNEEFVKIGHLIGDVFDGLGRTRMIIARLRHVFGRTCGNYVGLSQSINSVYTLN